MDLAIASGVGDTDTSYTFFRIALGRHSGFSMKLSFDDRSIASIGGRFAPDRCCGWDSTHAISSPGNCGRGVAASCG